MAEIIVGVKSEWTHEVNGLNPHINQFIETGKHPIDTMETQINGITEYSSVGSQFLQSSFGDMPYPVIGFASFLVVLFLSMALFGFVENKIVSWWKK